jgi:hypothetical protein
MEKKFYSLKYKIFQKYLHSNNYRGGIWGRATSYNFCDTDSREVSINQLIDTLTPKSILDYGCGKGFAADDIKSNYPEIEIYKFDPFVKEFSSYPTVPCDLVTCYLVMNQVEQEFRSQLIDELYSLTNKHLFLSIILPANMLEEKINMWLSLFSKYTVIFKSVGPEYEILRHAMDYTNPTFEILETKELVPYKSNNLYMLLEK